jgi:Ca-activated chloride channel homolog
MKGWNQPWLLWVFLACAAFAQEHTLPSRPSAVPLQSNAPYSLSVSVNEVSLVFHAEDDHGLPVNDLQAADLNLLDDGRPPRKILAFQLLKDFPIRAGILVDTSESMERSLPGARAISIEYAQRLLRQ